MTTISLRNGRQFAGDGAVSILDAAQKADVFLEYSCRTGRCGVCKAPVLAGDTKVLRVEESLSDEERAAGLILTCCRAPAGDVTLGVADLGRLKGLSARTLPCRIASIEQLAGGVLGVTLRLPPTAKFQFLPGQYIDVVAAGVRRSYSLANAPRPDRQLDLHIRQYPGGILSDYWFGAARAGDLLRLNGPLGTFFLREGDDGPLVFLATGTGAAPVKALLEELASIPQLAGGRAIHFYWGNREVQDIYWTPPEMARPFRFVPVLSRPGDDWQGRRGYVQQALIDDLPDLRGAEVYACGSHDMIKSAEALLPRHGLSLDDFHYDAFVPSV
jgi:CDP-4-dehydro-6-deoxyglucose reductase